VKVLFYNHTGMVSGAERVMQMILIGLDRRQFEPVVVCPPESPMLALAQDSRARTRTLNQLEARFTWRLDRIAKYLSSFSGVIRDARRIVIEESPALIHANSIRAGLVMSAATIGLDVPVIWHAHDILPHHPLSTAVRLFAALTSTNRILAVSEAVARRFRGIVLRPFTRRVPIDVIRNAVDLDRFQPNAANGAEVRAELNIYAQQPVVGIIGQLTPRKGQLELVQSFARVVSEIPDATLLIVGRALFNRDEEYAAELMRAAEALGIADRIHFLGSRDDVPRIIQALDVLVVNSHEEPFALTVLEGLASGRAVIATAVGGTPEMIQHGLNGWLVKAKANSELASGILTLLRDANLRAELGCEARRVAVARFSIDRFLSEVNTLYEHALQRGAMPRPNSLNSLEVKLSAD